MAKQSSSTTQKSEAVSLMLAAAHAADEISASADYRIGPMDSMDDPEERCYQRLKMIDSLVTAIHTSNGEFYNLKSEMQSFYHCAIAEFARGALVDLHLIQKNGGTK